MASVTIELSDDILARLNTAATPPDQAVRLAAAFSLCKQGQLATSQAAQLAGLTYAEFLDAAAHAKVELFPIELEELKEQIHLGYTLGRQRIAGNPAGSHRPA